MDAAARDEINRAIAAHGSWKLQLADVVRNVRFEVDVPHAADGDGCAFGRWLDGAGTWLTATAGYSEVRSLHDEFHRLASEVLELAVIGRVAEAQTAMSASSRFAGISAALTLALVRWQDEAA